MSAVGDIKAAIKTHLDALKTAGTLGTVLVDDFKSSFEGLYKNIATYPGAILGSPSTEADYETNRDNLRTYSFDILIVQKGENVSSSGAIEDLMEAIMNEFDNDYTLGGKAVAAVAAAAAPEPIVTPDGSFILFTVTLRARTLYALQ